MTKQDIKQIREIVKKYEDILISSDISVEEIVLFGSYAKNKANEFSDIDLAVISPDFGRDYYDESVLLRKLAINIDARKEPVPMQPDDLKNKYSTLATEINRQESESDENSFIPYTDNS